MTFLNDRLVEFFQEKYLGLDTWLMLGKNALSSFKYFLLHKLLDEYTFTLVSQ